MTQWSTTTKHEPSSINKGQRYELKDRVSIEQLNNMTENSFYAMEAASDAKQKAEEALSFAQGSGTTVFEEGKPIAQFDADKKADKTQLNDYYTKEQIDDLLGEPVDIDLSNYYTKSETYSKEQVNDLLANLDVDIDFSDYYTKQETDSLLNGKANKNDIPTNNNQLTNGAGYITSSGTSANATKLNGQEASYYLNYNNLSNKPSIPTTASEVNALPDTTKYGASIDLSINNTTYVVTAQLKDQNGNNLGTAKTIDLPLESVVVSGSYDSVNKNVVLTLKDGSTIGFSVADLISGLQSEITSTNKLSVNLISGLSTIATSGALKDATQDATHRTVTDTEKTTWNNKAEKSDIENLEYIKQITVADDLMIFTRQDNTNSTVNNFTYAERNKLAGLSNYNDSGIQQSIANLENTKANKSDIPDVSAFITKAVSDLENYYTKSQTYTQAEVNALVSAIPKFEIQVVTSLPTTGISSTTIYLLKTSTTETGNLYTEYIYVNGTWESLGTQTLDLSGYLTTSAFNTEIAKYYTKTSIDSLLSNKADKSDVPTQYVKNVIMEYDHDTDKLELYFSLSSGRAYQTFIPFVEKYIKKATVSNNVLTLTNQDGEDVTFEGGDGSKVIVEVWK